MVMREEFSRRRHSGGAPLLKTLTWRGGDCSESESFSFTFYFCLVNCCNTSQLLLLVGSRLLKLLLDNEMHINQNLCLFVFCSTFSCCEKQSQHHHKTLLEIAFYLCFQHHSCHPRGQQVPSVILTAVPGPIIGGLALAGFGTSLALQVPIIDY